MPLGVEVSLGIGHTVLDVNPAPPQKGAQQSSFSHFTGACFAYVRIIRGPRLLCSQTAAWIKMPFGTNVVLGPGHAVLDGTQLPPKEAPQPPPTFLPMSIVDKRLDGSRCHLVRR